MLYSVRPAKEIFVCGLFFLITLFFSATIKAQVVGGTDLTIQPDGKILVYGDGLSVNGAPRSIARLNRNSKPEAAFNYFDANLSINSAVVQSDGKIIIAGSLRDASIGFRGALVRRLNSNGTIDSTFTELYIPGQLSGFQSKATVWAVQADNKIIVSIDSTFSNQESHDVRRLNANGGADSSFTTIIVYQGGVQVGAYITKVALQPDEKILLSSRFNFLIGGPARSVQRYNQNGTSDPTFASSSASGTTVYNYVNEVTAGADGGIFIGGSFQTVSSVSRNNLAKLQTTGSLDTSFTSPLGPGAASGSSGDEVKRIAFTLNNQVIISTANRFLKLNSNGTIDTTFTSPSAITQISAFRVDNTGGIVFIGLVSGAPGARLWRLNADGSFDNTFTVRRPPFDFDGDGKSDVSVFRPSNGFWYRVNSSNNSFFAVQFGQSGDKIVPADYDGDDKTDIAVFRDGAFAYFYILNSADNTFRFAQFGTTGDAPVSGDWDADGKADLAVYRAATATGGQSNFYYRPTSQPSVDYNTLPLGTAGDKSLVGDFDGDGKLDAAVFRPSSASWIILRSSLNQISTTAFGLSTDIPTPADFDGDGRADIAVFRSSTGTWYTSISAANNYGAIHFGANGDVPVAADYDGDGRADTAVFRPTTGAWYLNRTTAGFTGVAFGAATDTPIPNAFVQ